MRLLQNMVALISYGTTLVTVAFIPVVIVLGIFGIIGGFCFPYALNSWLVFFGKASTVVFWQGFILGICPYIGQSSIPFAVVTFVLMMFLI